MPGLRPSDLATATFLFSKVHEIDIEKSQNSGL